MIFKGKLKVTEPEANALSILVKSGLGLQFHLIGHARNFSGNGIKVGETWISDVSILNDMPPILLAQAFISGYETVEKEEAWNGVKTKGQMMWL